MIAVIQRVSRASVTIRGEDVKEPPRLRRNGVTGKPRRLNTISAIGKGYVIFLGVCKDDTERDVEKTASKIATLRIMADEDDKMNRSILESGGEVLLVSQFTLCADLAAGRRPSFIKAKEPKEAERLYEMFAVELKKQGVRKVATGEFGAMMEVAIMNEGPVTIIVDSKK